MAMSWERCRLRQKRATAQFHGAGITSSIWLCFIWTSNSSVHVLNWSVKSMGRINVFLRLLSESDF